MKKVLYVIGGLLLLIVLALAAIPLFFKDKIKAQVDQTLAKSVNARVFFDANKFGLSLFSHFPNVSVSLRDFGVAGKEPFVGDTLVSAKSLDVAVNLWSVFGDNIRVTGL